MRASGSLALTLLPLVGVVLTTGCAAPTPKPVPAPMIMPATPTQAADAQSMLMKSSPKARVGHVAAIDTAKHIAVIAGIPIGEVHVGDSVQFTDAELNPFLSGNVTASDNSNSDYQFLIVEYQPVSTSRSPIKGDLAVYLPR